MEKEIHTLMGAFSSVLRPLQRRPRIITTPVMVFWDTEYDDKGLISSQFGWFEGSEFKTEILFLDTLNLKKLHGLITDLVGEHKQIFVISHFSQSELRHLSDLWTMDLSIYSKGMYGRYRNLRFIDSFTHFYCGLDKIGRSVGIPKIDIGDRIKDMRGLLRDDPDLFNRYALRDVEVLGLGWVNRRKFILERFGIDILTHVTTAHTSINAFKLGYLEWEIEPMKFDFIKKVRRLPDGTWKEYWAKDYYYAGSKDRRYYALKSYWGGRREAFGRGLLKEPVEIWDVVSMYPHMALLPLPLKGTKWFYSKDLTELLGAEGFVNLRYQFDEGTQYPCFPIMPSRFPKLVFPLRGEAWVTTSELRLANRVGCEFEDLTGWVFYPTRLEIHHPLREFLNDCIEIKNTSEKVSVEYESAKLMMNSIIGKFMQRNPVYSVEDTLDVLKTMNYDFEALQRYLSSRRSKQALKRPQLVSPNFSPEWGALILGRSRAIIGDFMNTTKALTGHTDSVIVRKGSPIECHSLKILRELGSDLLHEKEYDGDSFWIGRSAVYSPLRDGVAIKPTRHGYPTDSPKAFGDIIEYNLSHPEDPICKCHKTHLTTPREALRYGRILGSHEVKTYNINWVWDNKRKLLGPESEIWTGWVETGPWESIEQLIEVVGIHKRKPRGLDPKKVKRIYELRDQYPKVSMRWIAEQVGCAPTTVSKYLKSRV